MSFTFLRSKQFHRIINILSLVAIGLAAYYKLVEIKILESDIILSKGYYLIVLFLLAPFSWGIESARLKTLLDLSWRQSILSTMNGLLLRFIMASPGEMIGRQQYLPEGINARKNLASWTTLKYSAGLVSGMFGVLGMGFYGFEKFPILLEYNLVFISIFGLISILVFLFIRRLDKDMLLSKSFFEISVLHACKFLILLVQFVLAFKAFGLSYSSFEIISGMSLVLFLRSVIPVFHWIGEVGVREVGALYIFDVGHGEIMLVTTAVFIVWFVNNILTSIGFWIYKVNILKWKQ
ncbi:hypothetical protein [Marinigracilibium pacificum]|uniref:Lysylphosphatidylglycerol synthase-like protein n=1 Tax=Marinigracilibium pacificum TaxID=2729599 RepID=A0A848J8A5_9BACT|nr:hypothetical protein [Marinigracilibium pacificum]NMM50720.1 hypothetical protein [Marinigracilibium pacificum]